MTQASHYQAEIIKLRQRIEWLEAELARLTDAHASRSGQIMIRLKVSRTQANILSALATGKIMTRECIADMCSASEDWHIRNVDCHVKRCAGKSARRASTSPRSMASVTCAKATIWRGPAQ